jgi:hypothetical protein
VEGRRFVIEDPRTTFFASEDRQVVVHFEWEGAAGVHEYEARWKDPSGTVVLISPFKQTSNTARFGVYWSLVLAQNTPPGLWAVEATVDGQSAGVHTFTIKASRDGAEVSQPTRRPLSQADLYAAAQQATLGIEAVNAKGDRLTVGAGFLVGDGLVATAFQAIECATRVRILLPDRPLRGHGCDLARVLPHRRLSAAVPPLQTRRPPPSIRERRRSPSGR